MLEQYLRKTYPSADWELRPGTKMGIEILKVDHVIQELRNHPDRLQEYFTPHEIAYCQSRMSSYAGRLAGKQAVIDILGESVHWQDISIEPQASSQPSIQLTGQALEVANDKKIATLPISIAHDEGLAVAFVMGLQNGSPPVHLGTDISSVSRIGKALSKRGVHFLRKIYSDEEIQQASGDVAQLTEMWAGKEAVAKVLGTGFWIEGLAWTDISILTTEEGKPSVHLRDAALVQAEKKELENISIQLHHDPQNPMAFVVGV